MSQVCKYCNASGLEYQVNIGKLVNPITRREHGFKECQSQAIALYKYDNGVAYPRKEEYLARDIINEVVRLGKNPWNYRTVRKGDSLFVL